MIIFGETSYYANGLLKTLQAPLVSKIDSKNLFCSCTRGSPMGSRTLVWAPEWPYVVCIADKVAIVRQFLLAPSRSLNLDYSDMDDALCTMPLVIHLSINAHPLNSNTGMRCRDALIYIYCSIINSMSTPCTGCILSNSQKQACTMIRGLVSLHVAFISYWVVSLFY